MRYPIYLLCETKSNKVLNVFLSPTKAKRELTVGRRIEIWEKDKKIIYVRNLHDLDVYIESEKAYHKQKQRNAEIRRGRKKWQNTEGHVKK